MKKITAFMLSASMVLATVPVMADATATATSTFDGLVGVPVTADIPLTVTGELTQADITVSPATAFTLTGSDSDYKIDFTEDMLAGNEYTITAGASTIKYTTAYGTDAAKIPTNTGSGAGRTKTFDKTKNLTVKIDFMKYSELPGGKWIKLKDGSDTKMGVLVSNDNTNITLGMHRWDTTDKKWKGPGGETVKCNGDFTDVAYMTVKNNVATIFVVAADGTVRYATKWDFSGSTIKDAEFNTVEIDSILYGVEVGSTVDDPNEKPALSEATSTFNNLVGVPATASIPLTFESNAALEKDDVTILPTVDFTVEGSGTAWVIKPATAFAYGTEYTVAVGESTIKFTTAYGTDAAKIPTNTGSGAGRTKTFDKTKNLTVKIDFMKYTELPGSKWIKLKDDSNTKMGVLVSNDGTNITLAMHRWDTESNGWKGPGGATVKCNGDFTDVAYMTVKNNVATIFVVAADGTVRYATKWDFSGSTIKDAEFNTVEIDSILYGVEVGASTGSGEESKPTQPETSEKPSEKPSEEPSEKPSEEPTEDPDLKPAVSCSVNGKDFVPTNVSIPLSFNKTFVLNKNDVTITADGKPVSNFTLSTKDDKNYLVTFTGGLTERAAYSITVKAEGIDETTITFTTAYTTNKESLTVRYDGNVVPLSRVTDQLTVYGEITEATYSVGSNKYITLYDTTDPSYDEKTNKSSKYVKIWMRRQKDSDKGYGISMFIRNGESDKEHEFTLLAPGTVPLNNTSPIITLKDNNLYIRTINADQSVTAYDVTTKENFNTYIPNFKVGAVGGNGTSYLKIHTGYGDELKAELTSTGAKKDDTVKFTFSSDVAEYPATANITDGKTTVAATVTVDGKVATLTLPSDLAYSTIYSADLSGFKDRMGESAGTIEFETSAAPTMVVPGKVTATIGGSETTSIKAGELSVSLDVTKTDNIPTEFTKVDMMVGLYKKVDGKTYLVSMTKLGSADLTTDTTINSEGTVTVPQAAAGEEYFVKIFVYPQTGGAYSLIPSQTIK